jgi:phage-related baseplate assembly protein
VTGAMANGLLPGDLTSLLTTFPFTVTVTNTDTSAAGSDTKTTEAYRRRLFGITDSYSPGRPKGRYENYALAVSPAISDVSVMGPEDGLAPGNVVVTVLLQDGVYPTDALGPAFEDR